MSIAFSHFLNLTRKLNCHLILEEIGNNAIPSPDSVISDIELISLKTVTASHIEFNLHSRPINTISFAYRRGTKSYQGRIIHVLLEKHRILQILTGRINDDEELEVEVRILLDLPDLTKIVPKEQVSVLKNWWDGNDDTPTNNA